MAYAAETDIENEFKGVDFTGSTSITSATVSEFIDQADALIDQYLNARYVVPITGATSLLVVKKICIDIVAYRVAKILQIVEPPSIPDERATQAITEGSAYRESMRVLRDLRDGKMTLSDAPEKAGSRDFLKFYPKSTDTNAPKFLRDTKQW